LTSSGVVRAYIRSRIGVQFATNLTPQPLDRQHTKGYADYMNPDSSQAKKW
jgi:hypothetical protein